MTYWFLPGPSRRLAPAIKCNAFLCFQSYNVRDIWLTERYRWLVTSDNNSNDNNDDDLLTDPLDGSSLLNYINYNYKVNQIKLFTNYAVEAGLTESNYSKTD